MNINALREIVQKTGAHPGMYLSAATFDNYCSFLQGMNTAHENKLISQEFREWFETSHGYQCDPFETLACISRFINDLPDIGSEAAKINYNSNIFAEFLDRADGKSNPTTQEIAE